MSLAEVERSEGVGLAFKRLIRLWKCVEKSEDRGSRNPKNKEFETNHSMPSELTLSTVSFHPIKCGAAKLTNSRALTTFVAFQNLGKWCKFPVTR